MYRESYFDGGLFSYIGHVLLATFITVFTLGFVPWGVCIMYNWKVKHTVIDGRRQYFDGTAMQLFGNWIKWWFLPSLRSSMCSGNIKSLNGLPSTYFIDSIERDSSTVKRHEKRRLPQTLE